MSSAFDRTNLRPRMRLLPVLIFSLLLIGPGGCKKEAPSTQESASSERAPAGSVELVFPYGSEKEKWIVDVTRDFNQRNVKTSEWQENIRASASHGFRGDHR